MSPAGNMESLRYALAYGADAVYLGSREFGMRSSSDNFSIDELFVAAAEVHSRGKRLYLTLNTLPTNEEVARIPAFIQMAAKTGVDAFIVADLGVLALVKEHAPGVEIHLSTQAGIVNYQAARAAYELGAKRVILARELTLEDIRTIRENTPPDLVIEVFVHGAMCMSVSGRCLLANYMTGRDANRGQCPQACRWRYTLQEEQRPGQLFEIGGDEEGSYILSADDLCMAPFLNEVLAAGATSLKLEGRAKTFNYVASVTAAYRAALDEALRTVPGQEYYCPDFTLQELRRISHRPYSTGFFFGKEGATQSSKTGGYIREWQLVGVVEKSDKAGMHCVQRGKFSLGETLEVLMPGGRVHTFFPDKILDEKGGEISSTPHPKMKFALPCIPGLEVPPYSILRKKSEDTAPQR